MATYTKEEKIKNEVKCNLGKQTKLVNSGTECQSNDGDHLGTNYRNI